MKTCPALYHFLKKLFTNTRCFQYGIANTWCFQCISMKKKHAFACDITICKNHFNTLIERCYLVMAYCGCKSAFCCQVWSSADRNFQKHFLNHNKVIENRYYAHGTILSEYIRKITKKCMLYFQGKLEIGIIN